MRRIPLSVIFGLSALALAAAPSAQAQEVWVDRREALVEAVRRATPGTTIRIAPGQYQGGLQFAGLRGEPGRPVILAAADPANPPVIQGGGSGLHLTDPVHVELHHLVLAGARGNGLNVDDGGSYDSPARHLILRGLTIRDIGPRGNCDGMKLSGVDQFRVEDCTFERWGDSGSAIDMVGCHEGEVTGCRFQYRGDLPANGVQTKGGSRAIAIRRCRFEQAGSRAVNLGGSTGLDYFRPRPSSHEAQDITVEDCTFIGSSAPICFVGVDGAVVQYNTIYRPERYVVRILQESRGSQFVPCRNGIFRHNLIAFRGDELRAAVNIGEGTAPGTFQYSGNHWYCLDRPERSQPRDLTETKPAASSGTDPQFAAAERGDLSLREDSPVRDAGVRAAR